MLIWLKMGQTFLKKLIACQLDKHAKAQKNKHFADRDNQTLRNIGAVIAACITARYWKGVNADNDNMILEIIDNEQDD